MSFPVSSRYVIFALTLVGALVAGNLTERRIPENLEAPLNSIAAQIEGWTAAGDNTLLEPTVRALKPTAYLSRTYQKQGRDLDLFISFYAQQRAGESMHSPKHCLPGAGWEIWHLGSARMSVDDESFDINKYSIQNAGTRMLMFYWYQSKKRIIASEYLGKILLAQDTLLTGRTGGAIVRVLLVDTPAALDDGIAFSSRVAPEVWRCLGRSR